MTAVPSTQLSFRQRELTISPADLREFICQLLDNAANRPPALFLQGPDGEVFFGWGAAAEVAASGKSRFEELRERTTSFMETGVAGDVFPPWCGGLSFFSDLGALQRENPWEDFPNSVFFLPKYYLHVRPNAGMLKGTLIALAGAETDFPNFEASRASGAAGRPPVTMPRAQDVAETDRSLWRRNFLEFTNLARAGKLKKAVLSRHRSFLFGEAPDFGRIWSTFAATDFPNAYTFGFAWRNSLFFGATPEPILIQDGLRVSVPAIAGTHRRGATEAEDEILANKLLSSPKELSEHAYVVDFIRGRLEEIGVRLEARRGPEILRLRHLQHLFTPNEAHCESPHHPLEVLSHLHPTPAMCGLPSGDALEFVAKNESYERGFYASPIGFFRAGANWARFVVGIRSALLRGTQLHVFAGAGLVESSEVDQEWLETEQKMQTIVRVFDKNHA